MNNNALDNFIGIIGEINDRLAELQTYANDHMGYHPDDINWAHVGTASRFLATLTELTDLAFNRGEYSKEDNLSWVEKSALM